VAPVGALRQKVALLPHGRLVAFPRQGHALRSAAREDALDIAARFVSSLDHAI
jgi:hypothetical protein